MIYRSWRFAFAVVLLGAASASAQTPDYRRAEQFLGWNTNLMVAGDVVAPVWLDDGNRFWYRNKIKAGTEFTLIDPIANTKRPVFDHAGWPRPCLWPRTRRSNRTSCRSPRSTLPRAGRTSSSSSARAAAGPATSACTPARTPTRCPV